VDTSFIRQHAGMGKPDIREYPFGAGTNKVFRPRAAWRAGKGRQRGYACGRVNALPALTRPPTIPSPALSFIDQGRDEGTRQ
jgi:hypothetical protein